jgi:hypothetical protein
MIFEVIRICRNVISMFLVAYYFLWKNLGINDIIVPTPPARAKRAFAHCPISRIGFIRTQSKSSRKERGLGFG